MITPNQTNLLGHSPMSERKAAWRDKEVGCGGGTYRVDEESTEQMWKEFGWRPGTLCFFHRPSTSV